MFLKLSFMFLKFNVLKVVFYVLKVVFYVLKVVFNVLKVVFYVLEIRIKRVAQLKSLLPYYNLMILFSSKLGCLLVWKLPQMLYIPYVWCGAVLAEVE